MRCLNCHKGKAIIHPRLGILPCIDCQTKQASYIKPGAFTEFTTDDIKQQRGEFADDIEQTHYKGALNKRWVEIYGKEAAKKRGFSDEEIKHAEYVMDGVGLRYYNDKT